MAEDPMKVLQVEISGRDAFNERATRAFAGEKVGAYLSFATPELLLKTITAKRLEIFDAMAGAGPMSIRELARRVGRDVKAVHGDVQVFLDRQIIIKTEDGKIELPYEEVRVNFTLGGARAAAA